MVMVRSHQSTSADSFGLVRPAWIEYTRSAVPQNVEGLIREMSAAPVVLTVNCICRTAARFCYATPVV